MLLTLGSRFGQFFRKKKEKKRFFFLSFSSFTPMVQLERVPTLSYFFFFFECRVPSPPYHPVYAWYVEAETLPPRPVQLT